MTLTTYILLWALALWLVLAAVTTTILVSAALGLSVLRALAAGDRYGSQIVVRLYGTGPISVLLSGFVYAELRWLESRGLIRGERDEDVARARGGRPRRAYHVTDKGQEFLWRSDADNYARRREDVDTDKHH
jgi:DNA-binding PadR family transcriptional regulator